MYVYAYVLYEHVGMMYAGGCRIIIIIITSIIIIIYIYNYESMYDTGWWYAYIWILAIITWAY